MPTTHLWQPAAAFAGRAHRYQLRKDGESPYFTHTVRVALTVACVFSVTDEKVLAAALLHDTIEDTDTDYDDIHKLFGVQVADYVAALTKDMRLIEPKREPAYDRQVAAAPWQVRLIKLADVYDNLLNTWDAKSRRKQLTKAKRALKLAAKDKQLVEARKIVAQLVKRMSRTVNQ